MTPPVYSQVNAATCQQAANRNINPTMNGFNDVYDYVIIDEAARSNPLDLLIPMSMGKRIILVGDHKQLPHLVERDIVERVVEKTKDNSAIAVLKESLFMRLFYKVREADATAGTQRTCVLNEQFRMHSSICNLINTFYQEEHLKTACADEDKLHALGLYDNKPLAWIDLPAGDQFPYEKPDRSKSRPDEVKAVIDELKKILPRNRDYEIGVTTFYAKQAALIRTAVDDEFFKMAIDDISDYVTAEILSLQKSMEKNSIAIDWERYGNVINDYRRGELIAKLTRGKDASFLNEENHQFAEILDEWMKISRILLTIKSSAFYQSIDRNKHISKSIHLTNILKNDQRYKALYDMWCLVQREKQQNKETKGITGDVGQTPSVFYANYTCAAFLYSMHLLGISFDRESVVSFKDGCIQVNAFGMDNTCYYRIQSEWNAYKELELDVAVEEKLEVAFELPNCSTADFSWENVADFMRVDGNNAIFCRKPSPIERNNIYTLCQKPQAIVRQMSADRRTSYKNTLRIWREWVDFVLSSTCLRNPGQKSLAIKPYFIASEADKKRILELSDMLFEEADENNRTAFLLPTEWINYREVDDSRVLRRLLNFGDSFDEVDEDDLKNYRLSVLPVTQTDVGSIQRLMKLISLQRSVLMMEWQSEQQTKCPICQEDNIHRTAQNSWKCDNLSCGVEWGKTRCTTKCKEWFYWIQPGSDMVKKLRFQDVQCDTPCEAIQMHENIFDRYVITDFEIEPDEGSGNVKIYPICPICGGRRKR